LLCSFTAYSPVSSPLSSIPVFFFLMLRPPPRPTLFPYTTLFRSTDRRTGTSGRRPMPPKGTRAARRSRSRPDRAACPFCSHLPRSEEHTSELQSRFDLVCRLLLEKKKNIV